jgi:hypothetical protein
MIGTRHPSWEIGEVIARQICTRRVTEIILHHTWRPTAAEYKGEVTVENILRVHTLTNGWRNIAYHYIVAPDGTVWLGCPLNDAGTHTIGRNYDSVAVALILDGDAENPSQVQVEAATAVLSALLARFHLDPRRNFGPHTGFHRDYADKTCPGSKISKQTVLGWLGITDGA